MRYQDSQVIVQEKVLISDININRSEPHQSEEIKPRP